MARQQILLIILVAFLSIFIIAAYLAYAVYFIKVPPMPASEIVTIKTNFDLTSLDDDSFKKLSTPVNIPVEPSGVKGRSNPYIP